MRTTQACEVSARPAALRRWPTAAGAPLVRVPPDGEAPAPPESRAEYLTTWTPAGGRGGVPPSFERVVDLCRRVGLRGRGGAGFPLATKLQAVRDNAPAAGVAPVVVANGDEGEPASIKDRYLLWDRPHLVLDGLMIAAHALGAGRAVVYVADDDLAAAIRADSAPWADAAGVPIDVVVSPRRYVAGEETAVVRMINEGVPKPTAKPPRPYERGVAGLPTLVSNVETLAHLARLVRLGPDAVTAAGTPEDKGVTLLTVVPDDGEPCLVETPYGVTLTELLRFCGLLDGGRAPEALLTGGFFGGFLPRERWDVPIGHASMRSAGWLLGCGSVLVVRESCPVDVAHELLEYFARENARQCGVCMNGTRAMADALGRIARHEAGPEDRGKLERWGGMLSGRGDCALLDGACRVVSTLFAHGDGAVDDHLAAPCPRCARHEETSRTRFEVRLPPTSEGER